MCLRAVHLRNLAVCRRFFCLVDPLGCPGHLWPFAQCEPPLTVRVVRRVPPLAVCQEQVEYWLAQCAGFGWRINDGD